MAATVGNFSKTPPLPPISGSGLDSSGNKTLADDCFNKLSNVESQRIMSVLNELKAKIELVGLIPDHVDYRFSNMLTVEFAEQLKAHVKSELKLKSLLDDRENSEKIYKTQHGIQNEAKEVSHRLKSSIRTLYRIYSKAPNAASKLKYFSATKDSSVARMENLVHEVQNLVYSRLSTTVEEEKQRQDQLSLIMAREKKTGDEVKELQIELEAARKERSNQLSKRNDIVRKLKEELRTQKEQAEECAKRMESKSKQKSSHEVKKFEDRKFGFLEEIEQLKVQFDEDLHHHREEEDYLRRRKEKLESEVENWITKYDSEMGEKQVEFDEITSIYDEEKAQLSELQVRFDVIKVIYDKIKEEQHAQAELQALAQEEHNRRVEAATLIQAFFRGWKARKELAKKKSKGGKKKKR